MVEVDEALRLIEELVYEPKFEVVAIEDSIDRIIAQDIDALFSLPRFNNSAMDGYGVKVDSCGTTVEVIDRVLAGSNKMPTIDIDSCIKIMTGARVPSSVEAIVPFEDVEIVDDNYIKLPSKIKSNQHIRFVGEDIKEGELLIPKGTKITFAQITLLSSMGITHIKVYKKVKVTVFASGEELKLHYDKNIQSYELYNSNTPTLIARAKELGASVYFTGIARDSVESLKELIVNSLDSDLIITSGGVSVGEADFTKEAFNALNFQPIFDGIKIKPGKPTVFGKIDNTFILNLPGNPLASASIFELFGKVIIQKLNGSTDIYHNIIKTKLEDTLQNKKGRPTIIVGYFDGNYFTPSKKRSPGMVNILAHCNSFMLLDDEVELLEKNAEVSILPINWLFFSKQKVDIYTTR